MLDLASKDEQLHQRSKYPLEQIKSLEFDLAVLIQTQSQALEASPYLKMSRALQVAYNDRRKRIAALRETLINMKARLQLRMRPERAA